MKRTIAIFFLFTFLSANTAFGEVWKLPVLVRHYWEHSKKENNICFFEFLRIHYSDRSNHPAGSTHHHEKLPFKSAILQAGQIFTIALPPTIAFSKILYQDNKNSLPQYQQNNYTNNYHSQIWQPPRI